jgi:hypothetical protein
MVQLCVFPLSGARWRTLWPTVDAGTIQILNGKALKSLAGWIATRGPQTLAAVARNLNLRRFIDSETLRGN